MTALPTRPLGRTGMDITRVGFGAWAIGGGGWAFGWGPQDDDASVAGIRHAVDSGINWIDTAAAYGLGHSEEVVARAVAEIPEADRPYVFTKAGVYSDPANPMGPTRRYGELSGLRAELDASLRRLKVDRIDLYQMHWPAEDGTPLEDYWGLFLEFKQQGKIRAAGLSNHHAEQLGQAEALGHVDSLQPPFSLVNRNAGADVIPWCAAHETGVIVYSPMQSGLLSGSFTPARVAGLADDDWRKRSAEFQGDALTRNLALVDALRPVAERHGVGVGALAIGWTLAFPGVTGAIVGARSPGQVDGWIGAASLALDEKDLAEIAEAVERTGAGTGPVAPPA
ncbi:MAG TPA: aldo/keto reductase [Acidimicrobiales bacterium]|nr:aldo/keto reductase [Acidimicrobiales bacterium]